MLDITGALLLVGSITQSVAMLRQLDPQVLGYATARWRDRIPVAWARRFGSKRFDDTQSLHVDEYTQGWWGTAYVIAGFVLQLIGAWLPSGQWKPC